MKRLIPALLGVMLIGIAARLSAEKDHPATPAGGLQLQFHFSRLLVMPFVRASAVENLWKCPRCGNILLACPMDTGAEAALMDLLMDRVQSYRGFQLVPQEELNKALQAIPEPDLTQARLDPKFPFTLAERLQADAVLVPTVSCFRERQGNALASGKPAAVGFELDLLAVADRRLVWNGSYAEEQQPLLNNLLQAKTFFRRGAKWVTVDVLARDGMAKAMSTFPGAAGFNPAPPKTHP
jgi:hypothetical protein